MIPVEYGILKLKRTFNKSDYSDPVGAGKVLHRHIAPRVFTNEVRNLMHDIAKHGGLHPDDKEEKKGKKKRRLKKVSTRDKSAPYIPKDIEIYFYAGPTKEKNSEKKDQSIPLPPVSRTLPNAIEETMKEIQPKAPSSGEGLMNSSLKSKTSKHR